MDLLQILYRLRKTSLTMEGLDKNIVKLILNNITHPFDMRNARWVCKTWHWAMKDRELPGLDKAEILKAAMKLSPHGHTLAVLVFVKCTVPPSFVQEAVARHDGLALGWALSSFSKTERPKMMKLAWEAFLCHERSCIVFNVLRSWLLIVDTEARVWGLIYHIKDLFIFHQSFKALMQCDFRTIWAPPSKDFEQEIFERNLRTLDLEAPVLAGLMQQVFAKRDETYLIGKVLLGMARVAKCVPNDMCRKMRICNYDRLLHDSMKPFCGCASQEKKRKIY